MSERSNMYRSPIEIILGEIQTQQEAECVKVVQSYGFNVNHEQLKKALQYDREQYTAGYKDGYNQAVETFREMVRNVNLMNLM